jgi:hypothetical protein
MAHQKVPAVPEIAMAARMAVNREAPNKVIAAIRRCSPYWALCHAFVVTLSSCRRAPGIPAKAHIRRMTTRTRDAAIFVSPHCARNSAKYNFLARRRRRRIWRRVGASFDDARPDCSAGVECTKSKNPTWA